MTGPTTSFALPEGFDTDALAAALKRELEAGPVVAVDRRFYDTFDGRLHAAGRALAHERKQLALLDEAGRELVAAAAPAVPKALLAGDLPAGRLHDELEPLIEMRVLEPVARLRGRRRPLAVLDDERKTVVRLVVEEPEAGTARLHVAGVRGYDKELARVRKALDALGLAEAGETAAAEAMRRAGHRPEGVSSKPGVTLHRGERAGVAAARLCHRLTEVIDDNLEGAIADRDSEFLHDLRVAVRRTRSVQRELKTVFDPETLQHFRDEFKWVQQLTGPVRDLDVYLLDFDDFRSAIAERREADLEPLRELLVKQRAKERRALVRGLRSERLDALLTDWTHALDQLSAGAAGGPDAGRPVERVAGARIAKVYARMAKAGSAIDDDTPAEALHDLRKQSKELRYMLEFFGGLWPAKVVKPMVSTLKALQNVLGEHQDREVQAHLIAELGEAIADRRALMAMGQLVDRLERSQAEARAEFAETFAAFAAKAQRRLVKETF